MAVSMDSTGFSGSPKAFATVFWVNSPQGREEIFAFHLKPQGLTVAFNDAVQLLHHHQAVYLFGKIPDQISPAEDSAYPASDTLTLSPKTSLTY